MLTTNKNAGCWGGGNYCKNKICIFNVEKYVFSNEKKIQPHLTSFDPSKNYLPNSHQQNRPNSAKMLKKLCLINEFVCKEIGKEIW